MSGLKVAALIGLALGIGSYFGFAGQLDPIQHRHDGFAHSWALVFLLSAGAGIVGAVVTLVIAARARPRQLTSCESE